MSEHEAYTGDRTKEALVGFADSLIPSAGQPHRKHADLASAPRSLGCNMAGACTQRAALRSAANVPPQHSTYGGTSPPHLTASDIWFYTGTHPLNTTYAWCTPRKPLRWPSQHTGFVLVKKVPGTLHFAARSEGHSFDHVWMNMTHVTHMLYFGSR